MPKVSLLTLMTLVCSGYMEVKYKYAYVIISRHFQQIHRSKFYWPNPLFHILGLLIRYDVVSVVTCPNKNDGVKTAKRWCRGSKISRYQKSSLGWKIFYQKIVNSCYELFSINLFICDLAMWCWMVPMALLFLKWSGSRVAL